MKIKVYLRRLVLLAALLFAWWVYCLFWLNFEPVPVQAATYSCGEARITRKFQRAHRDLATVNYNQNTLYVNQPNFSWPFSAGTLNPEYISTSMAYVNYYRSLAGLPNESNYALDNQNAQIGAASLAAVNAATALTAHGLIGYDRPAYISKDDWETAENATLGNINFLESDNGATAGEIVTDLMRDDNNIAGAGNVGHRCLILSTRATRIGIGAAYGRSNGKFYSVENGIFADDILRKPVKNTVTYPTSGVFPDELLDRDTPWSYCTITRITHIPKIYITDLTTKRKYRARAVRNFGTNFYGDGYATTITYRPGRLKIINTHKYRVQIGKIYHYSFRLFRQNGHLVNYPKRAHHHKK